MFAWKENLKHRTANLALLNPWLVGLCDLLSTSNFEKLQISLNFLRHLHKAIADYILSHQESSKGQLKKFDFFYAKVTEDKIQLTMDSRVLGQLLFVWVQRFFPEETWWVCTCNAMWWDQDYLLVMMSGAWPACLHMRGPEGFFKTADCLSQKFYVCQNDADFSLPPQGGDIIDKCPNMYRVWSLLICPQQLDTPSAQ